VVATAVYSKELYKRCGDNRGSTGTVTTAHLALAGRKPYPGSINSRTGCAKYRGKRRKKIGAMLFGYVNDSCCTHGNVAVHLEAYQVKYDPG